MTVPVQTLTFSGILGDTSSAAGKSVTATPTGGQLVQAYMVARAPTVSGLLGTDGTLALTLAQGVEYSIYAPWWGSPITITITGDTNRDFADYVRGETGPEYDFTIYRGTTWTQPFTATVDLTGASVLASMWLDAQMPIAITTVIGTPASAGEVALSLTDAQTTLLSTQPYAYKVDVTYADGTVQRLLDGIITVEP